MFASSPCALKHFALRRDGRFKTSTDASNAEQIARDAFDVNR